MQQGSRNEIYEPALIANCDSFILFSAVCRIGQAFHVENFPIGSDLGCGDQAGLGPRQRHLPAGALILLSVLLFTACSHQQMSRAQSQPFSVFIRRVRTFDEDFGLTFHLPARPSTLRKPRGRSAILQASQDARKQRITSRPGECRRYGHFQTAEAQAACDRCRQRWTQDTQEAQELVLAQEKP